MVVEFGDRIVGFMIYDLHPDRLDVLKLATHPEFRRMGFGRRMVAKLVGKLSSPRRTRIVLHTRETNLSAQRFFRAEGFRATEVVREHYPDTREDAYVMEYQLRPGTPPPSDPEGVVTVGEVS